MKKPTKIERVLATFITGQPLHRFTAFYLRETCLHSTVSTLTHEYGLYFERRNITVNRQGDKVPVVEYRLPDHQHEQAGYILAVMRTRRQMAGRWDG